MLRHAKTLYHLLKWYTSKVRALVMNSLSISLHSSYTFPSQNLIWFYWIFDGIQSSLRRYDFICNTIKIPNFNFNFFFALRWCIERTKINTVIYMGLSYLLPFFSKMEVEERGEIYSKINNESSIFESLRTVMECLNGSHSFKVSNESKWMIIFTSPIKSEAEDA